MESELPLAQTLLGVVYRIGHSRGVDDSGISHPQPVPALFPLSGLSTPSPRALKAAACPPLANAPISLRVTDPPLPLCLLSVPPQPPLPACPATPASRWMESAVSDTQTALLTPADDGGKSATQRPERNSIVPPYWKRHERSESSVSVNSASAEALARPPPIQLEDHTDSGSEQCKACWAKSATIDDYVIVSGSAPGVGSYVVWNCTVETLDVSCPEGRWLRSGIEVTAGGITYIHLYRASALTLRREAP